MRGASGSPRPPRSSSSERTPGAETWALSSRSWTRRRTESSFAPPIGSGPYVVGKVEPGKSVTLERNPDYWGRELPINRGFWNFDEIRFDYYRDANSYHEAFKKWLFDLRTETDPGRWQTAYDFPAARDGRRSPLPGDRGSRETLCDPVFGAHQSWRRRAIALSGRSLRSRRRRRARPFP